MAAGDIYQLIAIFSNEDSAENLSFTLSGVQPGLTAPTMSAVGDDVKDWWDTSLGTGTQEKSFHPTSIALTEVRLRRVEPLEPVIQTYQTGLPISGAAAGHPLSPQLAPLVSLRTGKVGKSFRGRVYLPPMSESQEDTDGIMDTVTAGEVADQFEEFIATLAADNFDVSVWSRLLDSAELVTSVRVDRRFRTQRRRTNRTPIYVSPT